MVEDWIDKIPVKRAWQYQQIALMRQHLFLTGETHRILMAASDEICKRLMRGAKDEPITSVQAFGVMSAASEILNDAMMTDWLPTFQALRKEAGSLAFGTLAVQVNWLAGQSEKAAKTESKITDGVFDDQLAVLMNAASNRVLQDGLDLSSRIWQLNKKSLDGINRLVMEGLQGQWSAWDLAKKLEGYLGAGKDCPRWTRIRLYGLSKGAIASGDKTGLKSGDECAGQGVAYNALRMARNEIQAIHHMATDQVMGMIPWIEQEKINLSGAHPALGCECESVVAGGEAGDGVYPKGTISLPLHVGCLCYKTAVQMDREQFTDNLRGWMRGEQSWGAMDQFAEYVGLPSGELAGANLSNSMICQALGVWIFGKENDVLGRLL
jgi:hypothetical protein